MISLVSEARRESVALEVSRLRGCGRGTPPATSGSVLVFPDTVLQPGWSTVSGKTNTLPLVAGGVPRPQPLSLDTSKATLSRRASETSEIIPIHPGDWAFADCSKSPFPGTPDPGKICLKNGFDPAFLYELVYTAKDPLVLGIGFAATRDLNVYFKTGESEVLGKSTSAAIAWGNSQSGNFLRSF